MLPLVGHVAMKKITCKERIFSFRSKHSIGGIQKSTAGVMVPYNTKKQPGESIRVFLSNWTELDIWQYIYMENIPLFRCISAKKRPVIERDGMLIMVDDDRLKPTAPFIRRKNGSFSGTWVVTC